MEYSGIFILRSRFIALVMAREDVCNTLRAVNLDYRRLLLTVTYYFPQRCFHVGVPNISLSDRYDTAISRLLARIPILNRGGSKSASESL